MSRWGAIAAAIALIAAAACGDDDTAGAPSTTVALPTTAPTTAPSTTVPVVTLPPTSAAFPPAPQPSPEAAASALIAAWQAGDRAAADLVATVAAADALFAIPVVPASGRGCNQGGTDPTYCVYRTSAGELQLRIGRAGDAGWVVTGTILGT